MKRTWEVTENDGGGVTLYVWENNKLIYAHTGYEYLPSNLKNDINALHNGDNPRFWDGNDLDDLDDNESINTYDDKCKVICNQNGPINIEDMGRAGRSIFADVLEDA